MSYATERQSIGRQPVTVVELHLDFCSNTYGGGLESPPNGTCTAALSPGSECYNTFPTCQDTANYVKSSKIYRLCSADYTPPTGYAMIPCVDRIDLAPTKKTPGEGLGQRASVTITLYDQPHHDRGVDPYVSTRSYDPESRGTYFGKLYARNKYYQGRILKIRTGYNTVPFSWDNFEDRIYVIDRIEGPDKNGKVKIVAKDLLKLTDDAQLPAPTEGVLESALSASASVGDTFVLTPSGIGSDYSSGKARINDEVIKYTRSADTFTIVERGADGSQVDDHSAGDSAQDCKVYDSENIVDIVYDWLTTAGIDASYIPYATDWADERDIWLSSATTSHTITEPTKIKDMLKEVTRDFNFDIWWDERAQQVKLKAVMPPLWNETPDTLNEHYHIKELDRKVAEDKRITQVQIFWKLRNITEDDDKAKNYRELTIGVNPTVEGANALDKSKIKKIYSKWIDNASQAAGLATRTVSRFAEAPLSVKFKIDFKDDHNVGDLVDLNHRLITDGTGANVDHRVEILSMEESEPGHEWIVEALTSSYTDRYFFIAENTAPDYDAATDEEKRRYGYIANNDGSDFSDGGPPHLII